MSSYNGWAYTYDAQNRLIGATNGVTAASFYYDGKNRQIARSVDGAKTFSVWDDWELVEEYGTGNVRMSAYLQGAHGPIKSLISNNYFYQDSLGSTAHLASSAGALLEYYKYDLNGKPTYWSSTSQQLNSSAFGIVDLFAGERWIPELGLYHDRNRFMSPELGRFLQPDPIGFKGDGSNLYRYCGNDWANRTDPTGLETLVIWNESIPGGRNPFGHAAIATTGQGVHSHGNGTQYPYNRSHESTTQYLAEQAGKRNTTIVRINTTPQQEKTINQYMDSLANKRSGNFFDNCATRTGEALHQADRRFTPSNLPSDIAAQSQHLLKGQRSTIEKGHPEKAQNFKSFDSKPKSNTTSTNLGYLSLINGNSDHLSPGQQQMANGNYGAWNTNVTDGPHSIPEGAPDTAGVSTFLKAAGF